MGGGGGFAFVNRGKEKEAGNSPQKCFLIAENFTNGACFRVCVQHALQVSFSVIKVEKLYSFPTFVMEEDKVHF